MICSAAITWDRCIYHWYNCIGINMLLWLNTFNKVLLCIFKRQVLYNKCYYIFQLSSAYQLVMFLIYFKSDVVYERSIVVIQSVIWSYSVCQTSVWCSRCYDCHMCNRLFQCSMATVTSQIYWSVITAIMPRMTTNPNENILWFTIFVQRSCG